MNYETTDTFLDVLSICPVPAFVCDGLGQPVFQNEAVSKIFGSGFLVSDVIEGLAEPFGLLPRNGDRSFSIRLVHGGETREWLGKRIGDLDLFVFYLDDGETTAILEERVRNAEKSAHRKSVFLANMSHEIRTPLTSILGFASVLSEETVGPQQEFVHLIEESGKRLLETLNSVLDLSRLESRGLEMRIRKVSAQTEINKAVRLFEPLANAKGLTVTVNCDNPPDPVWIDVSALFRILANVIGNAVKFTESGSVHIDCTGNADDLLIVVTDTGPGISTDFMPHLFEEFRQEGGVGSTSHQSGSGLGLAIAKRLVDLMGGSIGVYSERGVGSRFEIRVPSVPEMGVTSATIDLEDSGFHSLSKDIRVLIVEDDPETCRLIGYILDPVCSCKIANDDDALESLLDTSTFDVILLDVNRGSNRSGIEILAELRSDRRFSNLPVVAMTAHALPGDRDQFLERGFDEYLAKPFTKNRLLSLLNDLVGK